MKGLFKQTNASDFLLIEILTDDVANTINASNLLISSVSERDMFAYNNRLCQIVNKTDTNYYSKPDNLVMVKLLLDTYVITRNDNVDQLDRDVKFLQDDNNSAESKVQLLYDMYYYSG